MTSLTLYGLKNCDTCKKALKALDAAGRAVTFVDIRADADLLSLVPVWLDALGAEALVNRRSTTWRSLDDGQKEAALSEGAAEVLQANPTLIKRPVLVPGAGAPLVGWTAAVQAELGI